MVKNFWKDENGAVTLFLLIILVAVFMFNAVLIDSARIMVAVRQTEHAAQAGVRSVLSNYNVNLLEYGLYGTDRSQAETIFEKVVTNNLSPQDDDYMNYLGLDIWEDDRNYTIVDFPETGMLASVPVFKQQVLEDMKYKASIQLIADIVDSGGEDGESNLDKLNFNMSEQLSKDEKFMDIANELQGMKEKRDRTLDSLYKDFQDIADDLIGVAQSDIDSSESETPRTDEELAERREKLDSIQEDIDRALKDLARARKENGNMNATIDANLTLLAEYSDRPKDILLQEVFFSEYEVQLKKMKSMCSRSSLTQSNIDSINQMLSERADQEQARKTAQYNSQNAIDEALAQAGSDKEYDASNVNEIAQNSTGSDGKKDEAKQKAFEDLREGLSERYKVFSDQQETYSSNNEEAAQAAVNKTNQNFKNGILAMFIKGRDAFYINEYALMYFNCHTTQNSGEDRLSKLRSKHDIYNEEVEYIIYGINTVNANFLAAGAEIYGIRLALHMSVGLRKFKYLADPKLIFLAAATYAAIMAAKDEHDLIHGETVDLYPDKKLKGGDLQMSYKDYMRLFLWQAGEVKKINRMQALMDLNTGVDLTTTPGYARGSARTRMKLWFLPGVMEAMGKARDGYCIIDRTAAMYY